MWCFVVCCSSFLQVDKGAFARHYPDMPATGFTTAYECMGLFGSDLPMERKWGFLARHMQNMRVNFPPCEGYNLLLQLVRDRDYFVLSSNVDGCFERAGFLKDRIYTPQVLSACVCVCFFCF